MTRKQRGGGGHPLVLEFNLAELFSCKCHWVERRQTERSKRRGDKSVLPSYVGRFCRDGRRGLITFFQVETFLSFLITPQLPGHSLNAKTTRSIKNSCPSQQHKAGVRGFVVECAFVLFLLLLCVCVCAINHQKSLTSLVAFTAVAAAGVELL